MIERPLAIAHVSTRDKRGGAEEIGWNLFSACRAQQLHSWLIVGCKHGSSPDVLLIPNDSNRGEWARFWRVLGSMLSPFVGSIRGIWQLRTLLYGIGQPQWWLEIQRGHEDFNFPGTWRLLDLLSQRPDIIHCHNLHGEYFDLRALPWLSQQLPVVLTLHDAWLLSGHCAHSFDCERWRTGCGHCPDLTLYPAIPRDATAYNWQRKREIFARSRLYVATPSHWLMRKVEQSILTPAILEARVIPNGVDLSVFHSTVDRQVIRMALGIPSDAKVLLFVANRIRRNIYKDYQTIRTAVASIAERLWGQNVFFIALGEDAPAERIGQVEVRFVSYQKDPKVVSHYYYAADVYVHAATAEVWGLTITEALACGTPVVATAVGGIPEQVKSLQMANCGLNGYPQNEATGVLVPPRDANRMAMAIERLLNDEGLCHQLGENAARDARQRFGLDRQVKAYLDWYQEIIKRENGTQP